MSFNLDSELRLSALNCSSGLAPMSFNPGSEQEENVLIGGSVLHLCSFNLGSEPLFSNLYSIVT